ncbi:MAG TPA: RrF2 family transcriptional regulator [Patescibacteria group bacterium]|nr:RrF2 family transcriptional regulator [Patescibacteria group bacterium]
MMFTTKTEYGLRAMVALAQNSSDKPLPLSQISKQEHISLSYLERLFAKLMADDLVVSNKGAAGGYTLSRKPKQISIFEIVEALDGPLSVFYCVGTDKKKFDCLCSPDKCLTQKVWHELQRSILKTLRGFTLADLVKNKKL